MKSELRALNWLVWSIVFLLASSFLPGWSGAVAQLKKCIGFLKPVCGLWFVQSVLVSLNGFCIIAIEVVQKLKEKYVIRIGMDFETPPRLHYPNDCYRATADVHNM